MSTEMSSLRVQPYIGRLKDRLGVKTDEELAGRLGLSKQAIANWRSRGKIPLKVQARMLDEFGMRYADWDYTYDSPEGDVVYAIALYVYDRLKEQLPSPIDARTRRTFGQLFPDILRLVSARLAGIGAKDSSADTLVAMFIAFIDSGLFHDIDRLIDEVQDS